MKVLDSLEIIATFLKTLVQSNQVGLHGKWVGDIICINGQGHKTKMVTKTMYGNKLLKSSLDPKVL